MHASRLPWGSPWLLGHAGGRFSETERNPQPEAALERGKESCKRRGSIQSEVSVKTTTRAARSRLKARLPDRFLRGVRCGVSPSNACAAERSRSAARATVQAYDPDVPNFSPSGLRLDDLLAAILALQRQRAVRAFRLQDDVGACRTRRT